MPNTFDQSKYEDAARERLAVKLRPSSLPFLSQCPCWVSDESHGGDWRDSGNLRHHVLSSMLDKRHGNQAEDLQMLPEEERDGVQWAADYIDVHAPGLDHQLHCERRLKLLDDNFNVVMEGTPDVVCGPELFDLKWRQRDYGAQMAAYAEMMFQENEWPEVRVHLLFAESKRAVTFVFTRAEAIALINSIIAKVNAPDRQPTPCDYCGWCARRLTCPALLERVNTVAVNREDWKLEGYHASEITSGQQMGKALKLARQIKDWCEGVEHHAKEMAAKQGMIPEGFKIQTRQGNRYIPDVTQAYARAGLPQEEFLKACEVKFSSLVEATAGLHGIKKAQAERTVEEKLGDAIQRKSSSVSLVVNKSE